ncbi:MAG: hypothetical protein NT023_20215 [Armatimonadetes bacterium]|nr:hypothetical protein [Armatimonadota bacterium]
MQYTHVLYETQSDSYGIEGLNAWRGNHRKDISSREVAYTPNSIPSPEIKDCSALVYLQTVIVSPEPVKTLNTATTQEETDARVWLIMQRIATKHGKTWTELAKR